MATKRKEPESQRISWFLYSFELPLLCISAKRYSIAGRISAASCSSHSCSINNSFCWKIWGLELFLKRKISIPSMQKVKCFLPFFPRWHRTRAAPFQRTAHGESAGGLKQESIKWVPRGSLATMRMRAAASWLLTESRRASVSGISGWKNSGLHQADFWAGRN